MANHLVNPKCTRFQEPTIEQDQMATILEKQLQPQADRHNTNSRNAYRYKGGSNSTGKAMVQNLGNNMGEGTQFLVLVIWKWQESRGGYTPQPTYGQRAFPKNYGGNPTEHDGNPNRAHPNHQHVCTPSGTSTKCILRGDQSIATLGKNTGVGRRFQRRRK